MKKSTKITVTTAAIMYVLPIVLATLLYILHLQFLQASRWPRRLFVQTLVTKTQQV